MNGNIGQIGRLERAIAERKQASVVQGTSTGSFRDVLRQVAESSEQGVRLSAHAETRLKQRQIHLSDEDMANINKAIDAMERKGARESLLLMRNIAFLVNVREKTLITAVDGSNMKDKVFTNIDSAMII